MSRIGQQTLMGNNAFAIGQQQPMLDIQYGGQLGFAPDLTEWVSNGNYVRRNLVCIMLEAPKFISYMPQPERWLAAIRSLLELHPRTIDGFSAGLTVDTAETPVGGAGEQQEEITNVTRARSTPTFTFDEKYGSPISQILSDWITYGMMDPASKVANVNTLAGNRPTDMLADMQSATCMFFEPDPTFRKVVRSWLTTNMWPKSTGDIIGKRDIANGHELTSLSVPFAGISQYNLGGNVLAQRLLDNINIVNANPYLRPAFVSGVTPDIEAQKTGYASKVANMASTAINRG
jgi:hypothetical protein